jgi:hypothetical protein
MTQINILLYVEREQLLFYDSDKYSFTVYVEREQLSFHDSDKYSFIFRKRTAFVP